MGERVRQLYPLGEDEDGFGPIGPMISKVRATTVPLPGELPFLFQSPNGGNRLVVIAANRPFFIDGNSFRDIASLTLAIDHAQAMKDQRRGATNPNSQAEQLKLSARIIHLRVPTTTD